MVHCNHRLLEREGERRDSYDHKICIGGYIRGTYVGGEGGEDGEGVGEEEEGRYRVAPG